MRTQQQLPKTQKLVIPALLCLLLFLYSCQEEKVPEPFYPKNDHEAYEKALEHANLLNTALGKEWLRSAQSALSSPDKILLPYEEAFYVDNKSAVAFGYSFDAKRGQKIQISITELAADSLKRFIDLFRIEENEFRHIASADSTGQFLGFEPRRDGKYILRFQSELLRGGTFKITFENVPTLSFPVAGKTYRSIGSVWGDVRDGGRRSHEGVDIFAPRGTPVIAPTDGIVRAADERGIGGKVVWLNDSKRSQNLYFAHLNDWNVKKGDRVKIGDTLGFVGNTGNARTTPPHLHFGIYSRGAMNPINHLRPLGRALKTVDSGFEDLGSDMRLNAQTSLFSVSQTNSESSKLRQNQVVKVIGFSHDKTKVQLPNGQRGYIKSRYLSPTLRPISTLLAKTEIDLLKNPDLQSSFGSIALQENFEVLGNNEEFLFVRTSSGQTGWIKANPNNETANSDED